VEESVDQLVLAYFSTKFKVKAYIQRGRGGGKGGGGGERRRFPGRGERERFRVIQPHKHLNPNPKGERKISSTLPPGGKKEKRELQDCLPKQRGEEKRGNSVSPRPPFTFFRKKRRGGVEV